MEKKVVSITKRVCVWACVILNVSVVALLFLDKNKEVIEQGVCNLLYVIFLGIICVDILLVITILCVVYIKWGLYNIKSSGDELFAPIDMNRRELEKDDFYQKHITIIKCVYKSKEMKRIVKNKELKRLYARLDFLDKNASLYSDAFTCLISMAVSFVVVLIEDAIEFGVDTSMGVSLVVISLQSFTKIAIIMVSILMLIFVGLYPYYRRGQEGSYKYLVDRFEREYLVNTINKVEKSIEVSEKHREAILTKQIIKNELIKKSKMTKERARRKEIESDLRELEKIELCISNDKETHKRRILIDGKEIYLIYKKKKKKDSVIKYIGKENLVNQDYVVLHGILIKNKFIVE